MTPPEAALRCYPPAVAAVQWVPLGAAGGFSGAAVWRGESVAGEPLFALKALPAGYPAGRLRDIHRAMAHARLPFVPVVGFTAAGETVVSATGRVWDLTAWMPGTADFAADASDARLAAAMAALAELHRAWTPATPAVGVCPGAIRRLEAVRRVAVGAVLADVPAALPAFAARVAAALRPWAARPVPLQLCLRDVWHDHVLFTGNRVTGIIDYGAVGIDHPAVDLARLLGDLVGTEPERVRRGVGLYHAAGGRADVDAGFVLALADGGLVGGVLRWRDQLAAGVPVGPVGLGRFRTLVSRLETRAAAAC